MTALKMERKEKPVVLSAEDLAAFDALPAGGRGRERLSPSRREREILLRYWPTKRHEDVARLIGHSQSLCVRWWREMQREGKA